MPNLPNLSNSRAFLASPNGYSGSDSYRERIRENISNTPRKSDNCTYTPRSIDLSIEKNLFRTVSRYNNHNTNNKSHDNDETGFLTQRSQKSARTRQVLFYNKNGLSQDNTNTTTNGSNNQQQHIENQENLDQFRNLDNNSRHGSENSNSENNYPSRRKRFEDNNFNSKNNNLDNLNSRNMNGNEPAFNERIKTAKSRERENAQTPVITPRKNTSYNNNLNNNSNNHNSNNDFSSDENPNRSQRNRNSDINELNGMNSFYEESPLIHNNLVPPKSARGNRPLNQSMSLDNANYTTNESSHTPRNIRTPRTNRLPNNQSLDEFDSFRSSSRTNMREEEVDSPPVPMPRKRDVSSKLLTNDNNDFRIKRVSSSKINLNNTTPRSTYMPSAAANNLQRQRQPDLETVDPNVLEKRRMDNELNQRIIKQIENSPRIKNAALAVNSEEAENTAEDLFFKSRRRDATSGRRQNARLDIGIDPNSILESKPRNNTKSRISFE